jgi:hypothetical protein
VVLGQHYISSPFVSNHSLPMNLLTFIYIESQDNYVLFLNYYHGVLKSLRFVLQDNAFHLLHFGI